MPQTPRNHKAASGPGRGTPRTRTTACPGERAHRPRIEPLDRDDVGQVLSDQPAPLPRAQRAMTATWRLIVLFIVIAGLLLVLATSLRVYFVQASELTAVREQIATEQERIADLEDQLNRWDDPEYVRSIARVRLGWVMPGEVGYRVLDADGKPLDGAAIELEAAEPPQLWWEKMWGSVQVADSPAEEEASEEPKASEPPRTIELTPDDEDD